MVLTFLTGKYGGDYLAIQRAIALGLIEAEIAHIVTVPGSKAAIDANLQTPKKVSTYDFSADCRSASFARTLQLIDSIAPDYIILAGFPFLLPPIFVRSFKGRIINSHHSILPAHPGLFRKEKLVASNDKFVGATIHRVDEGVDTGTILFQAVFPNYGMENIDQILKLYRFSQDAMAVQCIRDLGNGGDTKRKVTLANQIMFNPGIETDILEAYAIG